MSLTEFDAEFVYNDWLEEGREEGLLEGLVKGREEGGLKKATEAAINLLKMNLGTPEQIAQAEGLSLEQVLELQRQISVEAL